MCVQQKVKGNNASFESRRDFSELCVCVIAATVKTFEKMLKNLVKSIILNV